MHLSEKERMFFVLSKRINTPVIWVLIVVLFQETKTYRKNSNHLHNIVEKLLDANCNKFEMVVPAFLFHSGGTSSKSNSSIFLASESLLFLSVYFNVATVAFKLQLQPRLLSELPELLLEELLLQGET